MSGETRECETCGREVEFTNDDLDFFAGMQVDPPRLCGQCGVQRMMALRNEATLYKRECDNCKKQTLSLYHQSAPYVVYCHDCWWSDEWDGAGFAMEYDPARPLLEQFRELQSRVPREALIILNSSMADYGNNIRDSRNIYFSFQIANCENVLYSWWMVNTKDSIYCHKALDSELLLHCIDVYKCSRSTYLQECMDCVDCHFSYDLRGCSDCLFSYNLRNKQYCIENRQYSKEEYAKEKARLLDGSRESLVALEKRYEEIKQKALRRFAYTLKSAASTGNYFQECSDCSWCFDGVRDEHCRATALILYAKNVYYSYAIGPQPTERLYATSVVKGAYNCKFCFNLFDCRDCALSDSLISCANAIASVGLKKKEYIILNTRYEREEYEKIKAALEQKGELKDLPPPEFGTFGYNESAAQYQYPLDKKEALAQGYGWRDATERTTGMETIKPDDVPDTISGTPDTIVREILACKQCGGNYRVTAEELRYLRAFNMPVARKCPLCRFQKRYRLRLPFRLWTRACDCGRGKDYVNTARHEHGDDPCPVMFETAYAPDRPETVYCEQCYQAEVA